MYIDSLSLWITQTMLCDCVETELWSINVHHLILNVHETFQTFIGVEWPWLVMAFRGKSPFRRYFVFPLILESVFLIPKMSVFTYTVYPVDHSMPQCVRDLPKFWQQQEGRPPSLTAHAPQRFLARSRRLSRLYQSFISFLGKQESLKNSESERSRDVCG